MPSLPLTALSRAQALCTRLLPRPHSFLCAEPLLCPKEVQALQGHYLPKVTEPGPCA